MKKIILILSILLSIQYAKAQTAQELIRKMNQQLHNLKTLKCNVEKTSFYIYNSTFYYNIHASIVMDANAKQKPIIKKYSYNMTEQYDTNYYIKSKIFDKKRLIKINKTTREVSISKVNNPDQILNDFEFELDHLFYYKYIYYTDSFFVATYRDETMDIENIKFEVTSDTACLSGDCYLVKISAPSFLGVELKNDISEEETTIYYKDDIYSYWINKKTYFPERTRHERTLKNDSSAYFDDVRFTRIEKDIIIDESDFHFDKSDYKNYRIEDDKSNEWVTTQQAFVKAPNIKGISQKGDSINLYQSNSKIYIIDFWFSNCPACLAAKSFIETDIIPKYNNSDIMIIGVNPIDKSFEKVNSLLGEKAPQYPYILDKVAAREYHLSAYPGIYILNSKFEVIDSYNTFSDKIKVEISGIIKKQLK